MHEPMLAVILLDLRLFLPHVIVAHRDVCTEEMLV